MEETKIKKNNIRKIFVIIFMLVITAIVCWVSYFVATKEYKSTKKQFFQQESERIYTWVENTVSNINLWTDSLSSQSKLVSASEIYRFFAVDVASLDDDQVDGVNDDTVASLLELTPYMRYVLTDFMNLNGFVDARLLDDKGITFLSVQDQPTSIDKTQKEVTARSIKTNKIAFAPIVRYQNGALLHLSEPLAPVLNQDENRKSIATLLLSVPVDTTISQFLYDESQEKNFNSYIVQRNANDFEVVDVNSLNFKKVKTLLPSGDEYTLDFKYRRSVNDPNSSVWSYGTYLPLINWWVIAEIPALAIQGKLQKEATKIYGFAATFAIIFMLLLTLLWWIVIGREQKANAKRFESLYNLIGEQKNVLDNVNSALDTGLLTANVAGEIIMANRALGDLCSCDYENISGENLSSVFDSTFTYELLSSIKKVSQTGKPFTEEYSVVFNGETKLFRLTFFPFLDKKGNEKKATSNSKKSKYENAILITFTDITEFRRQSNAKRHIQEKSMQVLVSAVESMDPYLSGHSRRMEQLGVLICKELKLQDADVNTVAIAANLSQIGKLFVSRDLLLKTGELSGEEKAQLLTISEKAWFILKDIDFQLPVPQAVHEMYERLNGKGYPRQLSGEAIGLHARVLGIVNTFCAMTAPRAYRNGISIDIALSVLRNDNGYDQNIIDALEIVIDSDEGLKVATTVSDHGTSRV